MSSSNLPPGCSSPDGGIDHEYESALEAFAELAETPERLKVAAAVMPAVWDALADAFAEGRADGRDEAFLEMAESK